MTPTPIELLEDRIAPAVLVSPTTVTFTDTDGDTIMISVSHGDLTNRVIFEGGFGDVSSGPQQLLSINLANAQFAHANLTVQVTATGAMGDGRIHFGEINATGVDLGDVFIKGDVGKILAGDSNLKTDAMTSLTLHTLGNTSNVGAPDFNSVIKGPIGPLSFSGDMFESTFTASGSIGDVTIGGDINQGALIAKGSIGNVMITGNLIGGSNPSTGIISATANIEGVTVNSIDGGTGTNSGRISTGGNLGAVAVGSIDGGSGNGSGTIAVKGNLTGLTDSGAITGGSGITSGAVVVGGSVSGTIGITGAVTGGAALTSGAVEVSGGVNFFNASSLAGGAGTQSGALIVKGHVGNIQVGSITGGSGDFSGAVINSSSIASITVNGSVTGSVGTESGSISATGLLSAVLIKGSFFGGTGNLSGLVTSGGGIASITINGSVTDTAGGGQGSGAITTNGNLGEVTIHGSVTGLDGQPIVISALGKKVTSPGSTTNPTINSLEIDGDVAFLSVLAGYDTTLKAKNADAQIETVHLEMGASGLNLIAGAVPGSQGFGTAGDKAIAGGSAALLSKIVSVTIDGAVTDTPNPDDHFGIVAQEVVAVSVDGTPLTLTSGPHNDQGTGVPLGTGSTDAVVREI